MTIAGNAASRVTLYCPFATLDGVAVAVDVDVAVALAAAAAAICQPGDKFAQVAFVAFAVS